MSTTKLVIAAKFLFELLKIMTTGAGIYYLVFIFTWYVFGVNFLGIVFLSATYVKLAMFVTMVIYLTIVTIAIMKQLINPKSAFNVWRKAYEARKAPKYLR